MLGFCCREWRILRCLLISALDPWQKGTRPLLTPLSLAYLAGFLLKKGHEARIFQREVEYIKTGFDAGRVDRRMIRAVREFEPQVVGFSSTSATIGDLLASARLLRKYAPDALFVCGGPHVSPLPEETLRREPCLDVAVIGDGEEALAELCSGEQPERVAGIAHRSGAEPMRTARRAYARDLDFLPYPARHLLDMGFHTGRSPAVIPNLPLRTTTIVSARGCPFACAYCAESRQKVGLRAHSPAYVIGEVEHLLSRYRFEGLYFIDSLFEYNRRRTEELCRLLVETGLNRKLVWSVQARATGMDRDLLRLMKEAGCVQIEYGFESGSQRVLDAMRKKSTVEAGVRAAALTRECGIRVFANMIFGYPGETEADFDLSAAFIKKIKPDAIGAYQAEAYPGTALYEQLVAAGRLPVHYQQPGADWSAVEIQRQIRKGNLSAMPDAVFARKMEAFRRKVVGPLTTADTLRSTRLKSLDARTLAKLPLKLISQPARAFRVAARMVRG